MPSARVVLGVQKHKQFWDKDKSQFVKLQGVPSTMVDRKLGISLDAFQNLDMRSLR